MMSSKRPAAVGESCKTAVGESCKTGFYFIGKYGILIRKDNALRGVCKGIKRMAETEEGNYG